MNVCYVLILDDLLHTVRAEQVAAGVAQAFSNKPISRPDVAEAVEHLNAALAEPLPDPTTVDLRQALGLDGR